MKNNILLYNSNDILYLEAAKQIQELAFISVQEKDFFTLVLSGGNTPKALFKILSSRPFSKTIPWNKTYIFFADERFLPKDKPELNFNMANDFLFSNLGFPEGNIFPVTTKNLAPADAAIKYENEIRNFFQSKGFSDCSFDLILLGAGSDGHTASLFPGSKALEIKGKLVSESYYKKASITPWRITMTLPLINKSKSIFILITGYEKRKILSFITNNPETCSIKYPVTLIKPKEKIKWFLCQENIT